MLGKSCDLLSWGASRCLLDDEHRSEGVGNSPPPGERYATISPSSERAATHFRKLMYCQPEPPDRARREPIAVPCTGLGSQRKNSRNESGERLDPCPEPRYLPSPHGSPHQEIRSGARRVAMPLGVLELLAPGTAARFLTAVPRVLPASAMSARSSGGNRGCVTAQRGGSPKRKAPASGYPYTMPGSGRIHWAVSM